MARCWFSTLDELEVLVHVSMEGQRASDGNSKRWMTGITRVLLQSLHSSFLLFSDMYHTWECMSERLKWQACGQGIKQFFLIKYRKWERSGSSVWLLGPPNGSFTFIEVQQCDGSGMTDQQERPLVLMPDNLAVLAYLNKKKGVYPLPGFLLVHWILTWAEILAMEFSTEFAGDEKHCNEP